MLVTRRSSTAKSVSFVNTPAGLNACSVVVFVARSVSSYAPAPLAVMPSSPAFVPTSTLGDA